MALPHTCNSELHIADPVMDRYENLVQVDLPPETSDAIMAKAYADSRKAFSDSTMHDIFQARLLNLCQFHMRQSASCCVICHVNT